jgi:cellulose synthase/poly-beta-1,6-N-acetylglucosamine synthase-like glycosyltransferase
MYSFLLRGLFQVSRMEAVRPTTTHVSVIICLHNEEQNVPGLMQSLQNQDYPADKWELILVNDRSSDETEALLIKWSNAMLKAKIIKIESTAPDFAPKKYAIDRAIHSAEGSIILLTDADGRPGPLWIRSICNLYTEETGMIIGFAPYITEKPFQKLIYKILALEYMSHATVAASSTGLSFPITCVGTNLSYRKSVYLDLGGFGRFKSYHSGDDDLFLQRVRDESTWKIRYIFSTDSHVPNAPPAGWAQFINQRLRYASKGLFYPIPVTLSLLVYFLFSLFLFTLPVLYLLNSDLIILCLGGWLLKIVFEFVLLYRFSLYTENRKILKFFPLATLLHVPYVVFFGLFGPIIRYKWAGRFK